MVYGNERQQLAVSKPSPGVRSVETDGLETGVSADWRQTAPSHSKRLEWVWGDLLPEAEPPLSVVGRTRFRARHPAVLKKCE